MAFCLHLSLILVSLLPLLSSLSPEAILDASDILNDSGFSSMALTLELASRSLLHHSSSLTIFAPADSAFSRSRQPPLSLLQYHLLPHAFSFESLCSLPSGAKISTMLPGRFLTVTNDDTRVSLNNVTVNRPPIYDDGSLIIFAIEKFFNPFFESSNTSSKRIIQPDLECRDSSIQSDPVGALAAALRNRGWSVMASFLDLQVLGFHKQPALTIFAPADDSLMNHIGSFSDWISIFRRHVVPCKLW
ncbi:putative fasciclin-like arabinogalactan protein 20 [Benincasa hispida]|uniref:putative fasciclin-like arabinogalactan protein 20 n=1 Tax=Benincasa hispida TaxID=102211 RepID=UPI0018FF73D7|nr:putative fasciclin-like arabinogalactan protein 20 [Benincasa hispida]